MASTEHTFYIKEGDTLPVITEVLEHQDDAGVWAPIDLTDATVKLHLKNRFGSPILSVDAEIDADPETGRVSYEWVDGDTSYSGRFVREWEITYSNTKVLTVPNKGRYWVIVEPQLDGGSGPVGPPPGPVKYSHSALDDLDHDDHHQYANVIESDTEPVYPDRRVGTFWLGHGVWDGDVWVSVQGATGPAGQDGFIGSDGATGPPGATGSSGPSGSPGSQGPSGVPGSQGVPGAQGPSGVPGGVGATGASGPRGFDGIDGETGPPGGRGATGASGPAGASGTPGSVGATGASGSQGPSGVPGSAGADGAPGSQGPSGVPGPAGATGPQGNPGADSSVPGPAGATGASGSQGPSGTPGSAGGPGATGATGSQGVPGNDGAQGSQGPSGVPGSQGPSGVPGSAGATGSSGPSGVPGSQGPTGPQGTAAVDGLLKASNLSDVANVDTARGNLNAERKFQINVLDAPYGAVESSTTDSSAAIQAALDASQNGIVRLGHSHGLSHPIVVPNGVALKGNGGMQFGSMLTATSSFPTTTITGDQTVPANGDTVNFTLNVGATAAFPLGSAGRTLTNGQGVLCCYGITIYYTGVTSTSFTGCRVVTNDVGTLLPGGTPVSTFMVWLCEPGSNTTGFDTRIDSTGLDAEIPAGASCIHSCHIQEGGGCSDLNLGGFENFGIRIDGKSPTNPGGAAAQWDIGNLWVRMSTSANDRAVGIDIMEDSDCTQGHSGRGLHNVSITRKTSSGAGGLAGLRLNGTQGRYSDFAIESQNIGILVGDKARCAVTIEDVKFSSTWGTGAGIELGDTPGNAVTIRRLFKSNAPSVTARKSLVDRVNSYTSTVEEIEQYVLHADGSAALNDGARVGTSAARPAVGVGTRGALWLRSEIDGGVALAQDDVASGARTSSTSATLTVTFTKTTTAGNHLILAVCSAGTRILSSIATDSRGNVWQIDEAGDSGVGATAGLASCLVTTPHQIGDTVVLTLDSTSSDAAAIVSEWSGLALTDWADLTKVAYGASGIPSSGAMTTRGQPDELVFAAVGYFSASDQTQGAGYTLLTSKNSGAGNRKITPQYKIASTATADTILFATDLGVSYEVAAVTYKARLLPMQLSVSDGITWGSPIADHLADPTAAHAASAIAFTPDGSIAATDVQAAIQEVRDEAATGGVGATGPQGPSGVPGSQGPSGVPGSVGATGSSGPSGTPGSQGPSGVPGSDGSQGPSGVPGSAGATGPPGATGAPAPTNDFNQAFLFIGAAG